MDLGDGVGKDFFDDMALLGEEGDYPAHFEDVGLARFVFRKGFPIDPNNDDNFLFRVDDQVELVELEIEGPKTISRLGKDGSHFFGGWHGAIIAHL